MYADDPRDEIPAEPGPPNDGGDGGGGDIVDEGLRALRGAPAPALPEATISKVVMRLRAADVGGNGKLHARREADGAGDSPAADDDQDDVVGPFPFPRASAWRRFAAAAVVVLAAGTLAFVILAPGRSSIVLADVLQRIRAAHTVSYTVTARVEGREDAEIMTCRAADGGLLRMESERFVQIINGDRGIMLDTQGKVGGPIDASRRPTTNPSPAGNLVEELRDVTGQGTPVGECMLDGRETKGFEVSKGAARFTVWADAETGMPVQIETTLYVGGRRVDCRIHSIVFDAKMDPGLFSLELPAGYAPLPLPATRPQAGMTPAERELVELLGGYARRNEGRFPRDLEDLDDIVRLVGQTLDGDAVRLLELAPRVHAFVTALPAEARPMYAGAGTKLGERRMVVFWYRQAGGTTFRVLFADLRFEDLPEEQLPPVPKGANRA